MSAKDLQARVDALRVRVDALDLLDRLKGDIEKALEEMEYLTGGDAWEDEHGDDDEVVSGDRGGVDQDRPERWPVTS